MALVTGASAGIGREFARQLVLERGYRVLGTARRRERLETLKAELPEGTFDFLEGDLASAEFRARLWDWAESASGGVTLLVNNAGLGHYDDLLDQDFERIRDIFEINVLAMIDLTQRAGKAMRARGGGEIVQVSSVLGFVGLPYSTAYVSSKYAVIGLVTSLRYELRGTGVRVWAACPGRTESEFRDIALEGRPLSQPPPKGAPTDLVVRAFLNKLGTRRAFIFPNLKARIVVDLAHWLPGPFDWFMSRFAPTYFAGESGKKPPGRP